MHKIHNLLLELPDYLVILCIRMFQQMIRLLPERGRYVLGVFLGHLAYLCLKERRVVAIKNIRKAFPESEGKKVKGIAKRCFKNLGVNFIELLNIPYIPKERYKDRFTIVNREYIDRVVDLDKGMIALVFHYGNWEIMGVASAFVKNEVVALARPLKYHNRINTLLNSLRASTGLKIIPNANTAKDVMRYLREKKIVAILADQREKRSKCVYVEFFGEKVPTNKGVAAIGMKTGALIIPLYLERIGFLRYRIVCNEPIEMERDGNVEELIYKNTRKINSFLESIIIKKPEEWFWVHRRWGRDK
ncbi:MAG: lysophospholipid acyltransferase family protein [Syntrophorhabdaceae bacterium]|nr:lysophospholipid acyltransferase family protein [Syntrophorhabdaceae bacterium]